LITRPPTTLSTSGSPIQKSLLGQRRLARRSLRPVGYYIPGGTSLLRTWTSCH
jgi:hypothetical protein